MKKLALIIMLDVIILLSFVVIGVAQTTVPTPATLPTKSPGSELIVPILTSVAVISESLPLLNKRVGGIIHLLVYVLKFFKKK